MQKQKIIPLMMFVGVCLAAGITLIWLLMDPIPSEAYWMHPEPFQTVFEDTVEIITEEVVFEQDAKLSDRDMLARMCMGEAGNQPLCGKIAVVVTALNRSNMWDKSIHDVLTDGSYSGYPYYGIVDEECYNAVDLAYMAVDAKIFPEDMLYFRNKHYHTFGEPYTVIGSHWFSCEGDE